MDTYAFVSDIKARDAAILAWCRKTGRTDRYGRSSYMPGDLPAELKAPTNEERSQAEVIEFRMQPLQPRVSYLAYLSDPKPEHTASGPIVPRTGCGVITTFMGDLLAVVYRINSYKTTQGWVTDRRGSFWAIGIDGRTYYGRHNGKGMYCRMRLAKYRTDFDIQQWTKEGGWETVTSEQSRRDAIRAINEYRDNAPMPYRIKPVRVDQWKAL